MTPVPTGWAEAYCRQLAWMVELLWRHELPIIAAAPAFTAAETILDLGAGNGAFGSRLAAAFPDKRFLGVEPDGAIHAIAARTAFPPNYRYVHAGYESVTGSFDLLLARLVVMFLPDRGALYEWARAHVRAAIVVNYDDSVAVTEPPLPLVEAAVRDAVGSRAEELSTAYFGDRDLDAMPAEWAAAGFLVSGVATLVADVAEPDDKRIQHHIHRLSLTGINPDALSRPVLDELYEWSVDPSARATIGLRYHSLLNPLRAAAPPGGSVVA